MRIYGYRIAGCKAKTNTHENILKPEWMRFFEMSIEVPCIE
jgi:hypothetical protein